MVKKILDDEEIVGKYAAISEKSKQNYGVEV